jgi:hypothetical protein
VEPAGTNIATVSYISKGHGLHRRVFAAGALYTVCRVLSYPVLAALLVASVLFSPQLSNFLQTERERFLGPILIPVVAWPVSFR